jgi:hypothetical protein
VLPQSPPTGGTIGLWCGVDLPGQGDDLVVQVLGRELTSRLGDWCVRPLAPFGWTRPHRADGGLVAEPLGDRTAARVRELDSAHDLSLVVASFPLGGALAERYGEDVPAAPFFTGGLGIDPDAGCVAVRIAEDVPAELVSWFDRQPAASVRDEVSRDRLRAAGVRRDVPVVSTPALLADRLHPARNVPPRVEQLRQLGHLPPDGRSYLLAHVPAGSFAALRPAIAKTAELLAVGEVVLLPAGSPIADAGWRSLPADAVLEDRLTAIAGASAVVAGDEQVAAVAEAYGRNWVLFDPTGSERAAVATFAPADRVVSRPSGLAAGFRHALRADERSADAVRALDAHLDEVCAAAERAHAARGGSATVRLAALVAENQALRAAQQRMRDRIAADRHLLVERLLAEPERPPAADEPELAEERRLHRELAERHRDVLAALAAERRELEALRSTKLFRWTRLLRAAYGKLR